MAKQEIIKNVFGGQPGTALDKIDKKYLQYVQEFQGAAVADAITAFRTKDITAIETTLKNLAGSMNTASLLIGLGAVIIEREKLYRAAGYNSYLEYAQHLFDDFDIPISTIGTEKIIMENFIDYNRPLSKAGFKLERNANKLRYLKEALQNHEEEEVFTRIASDSFRTFRDWAQRPALIQHRPGPDLHIAVEIKGNKLLVDGQNVLNFPRETSDKIREFISADLERTFSIRGGGNLPFIVETYDKGEQTAIENFLKKYRAKK